LAYEVDGFAINYSWMTNVLQPRVSLSGCSLDEPPIAEPARALSESNPYYFEGTAAKGVGGLHEGLDMSAHVHHQQALTSSMMKRFDCLRC
jgi:meiotically up-regulated gene 157 (Mug157) protein